MIVRRATKEDLTQLAVLFDEYRQFYGASSNLDESHHFLKQRFENKESVFFIHIKDEKITGFVYYHFLEGRHIMRNSVIENSEFVLGYYTNHFD